MEQTKTCFMEFLDDPFWGSSAGIIKHGASGCGSILHYREFRPENLHLFIFVCFSLVFPGKSKKFPDPGWSLSLSYHTGAP